MDKPLCKLCKTKHWKNEPCVFPDLVPEDSPEAAAIDALIQKHVPEASDQPTSAELRAAYDKHKARNRYQRDLMRKRRSKP